MYNSIYPININYRKYNQNQLNKADSNSNASTSPQINQDERQNKPQNSFPNGTKVAIDYTKGEINISQVLTDFKNTIVAINAPDDVKDEVYLYLNLVDRESRKENPSKAIVFGNLKNASVVSDEYIAKTLNKKSNVVEGWIDALFMQKINLKANPDDINPDFLLDFPKKAQEKIDAQNLKENIEPIEDDDVDLAQIQQQSEIDFNSENFFTNSEIKIEDASTPQTHPDYSTLEVESSIDMPDNEDEHLSLFYPSSVIDAKARELFSKAKNMPQTTTGYTDAVNLLNEALGLMETADEHNTNIKAAIHFERGKIFDNYDYVDYALRDYFEATKTDDYNLKAQAYYKSGQIYDEFREYSPALDNYLSSVAYSGEIDNYSAQSTVLSKIAALYAKQYDIENTDDYSSLALESAMESDNDKLLASIYSDSAQNYQYLGENEKALDRYKKALKIMSETDESYEQMAYNYEQASVVMDRLGNTLKAQKLQQKALKYYELAQQLEGRMEQAG